MDHHQLLFQHLSFFYCYLNLNFIIRVCQNLLLFLKFKFKNLLLFFVGIFCLLNLLFLAKEVKIITMVLYLKEVLNQIYYFFEIYLIKIMNYSLNSISYHFSVFVRIFQSIFYQVIQSCLFFLEFYFYFIIYFSKFVLILLIHC